MFVDETDEVPRARSRPIKSTFATVRLRTKVTKGLGSRCAGLAMSYKLIDAAQSRWRAVNAPHLVALVRAGVVFHNGKMLEPPSTSPRLIRPPPRASRQLQRSPEISPIARRGNHSVKISESLPVSLYGWEGGLRQGP